VTAFLRLRRDVILGLPLGPAGVFLKAHKVNSTPRQPKVFTSPTPVRSVRCTRFRNPSPQTGIPSRPRPHSPVPELPQSPISLRHWELFKRVSWYKIGTKSFSPRAADFIAMVCCAYRRAALRYAKGRFRGVADIQSTRFFTTSSRLISLTISCRPPG
jgi:hypothetical protein